MEQNTYTRKQLYDLVWSEPSSIIAERHGISEHIFKTICRKHQIHQPRKGHWSKVKHGRPVKITPFQEEFAGSDLVRVVPKEKVTQKWRKWSPRMLRRKDIETSCSHLLVVPNKLAKQDPLIEAASENMSIERGYLEPHIALTDRGFLSFDVNKRRVDRALRIFGTIIKVL